MSFQTIVVTRADNGCATITLNRPERRNAISIRMRQELSECLAECRDDDSVGAVIITGSGKTFSAGFDLDEFREIECHTKLLESSSSYHRDLWDFSKPTIAAVNGPAIGGGFDLACFCDIRIAAVDASFGHPEIKFGAPPLYTPLRWIVGDGFARELCLTGRRISADEALRIGLVSAVVDAECLLEEAEHTATAIQEAPADAVRFLKRVFATANGSFENSFVLEHDQAFREIILNKFPTSGS